MPGHANFAAAIAIRQELFQSLIRTLYHANQIGHLLNASDDRLAVDFYLDIPELICSIANANRLALNLRAWGSMTVTLSGATAETRQVLFNACVLANPRLSLENQSITLSVDGLGATLNTYQIEVLSGGAFSVQVQLFLDNSEFGDRIQTAVRLLLATMTPLAPPGGMSLLRDIANSQNTKLTPCVLDGALAIGLDVDEGGVQTKGDPKLLQNIAYNNDIGMWLNPVALPIATASIRKSVIDATTAQDATLEYFSLTLEAGHFHIAGRANKTGGSVNFSMNAAPRLIRPGKLIDLGVDELGWPCVLEIPPRHELWFELLDVSVDVQRDWWVYLVEVFAGLCSVGIGALVVEDLVDMVRNNVHAEIKSSSGNMPAPCTQEFTLPHTGGLIIRWRLNTYECHPTGVYAGFMLRPQFPSPALEGNSYAFIEGIPTSPPRFSLRLPFDTLPDDPQLRVRWTVRRTDLNEVVFEEEGPASAKREITLAPITSLMLQVSHFTIECRVYRVLGAHITDFFNVLHELRIGDTLDRSHPYVRWHHWVFVPVVQVEADGSQTRLGYKLTRRISRIHRTDFPGRCRMVSSYSLHSPDPPRSPFGHPVPQPLSPPPEKEYLDALPFAREELMSHRAEVCDYCFFGGPQKTKPLIP
jgi:hypothetical protein